VANDLQLFNFNFFERVIEVSAIANQKIKNVKEKKTEKNIFYQQELLIGLLTALSLCTQQERNRHMLNKFLSIRDHFKQQCAVVKENEPRKKKIGIAKPQPKTDYTTLFYMVRVIRLITTSSQRISNPKKIRLVPGSIANS
jgi:hypothetical protein